jgi:hypothetical protein
MITTLLLSLLAIPPAYFGFPQAPAASERPPIVVGAPSTTAQTLGRPYYAMSPPDRVWEGRDFAKTWGMHEIAVIQAAHHDVQGAKRTLTQIGDDGEKIPADVTGVCFCNGQIIYDHPPGRYLASPPYEAFSFDRDRTADRVPSKSPPGLPSNYLAPDPRRGAVVAFVDECDSRGVRVTSRRYADGSVVIETPHPAGKR